jgi:esterase/lipase superfamily enzyme
MRVEEAHPVGAAPPVPVPTALNMSYAWNVLFSGSSSVLRPEAKATLDHLAAQLQDIRTEVLIVTGYADKAGAFATPLELSRARAKAVQDYLVAQGVDPAYIHAEGAGVDPSAGTTNNHHAQAAGNRANIELVGADGTPEASVWRPNNIVPVFFATDRKATGSSVPEQFYGNVFRDDSSADSIDHGVAVVRIPPRRRRGEIKMASMATIAIEHSPGAKLARRAVQALKLNDPETQFSFINNIETLDGEAFKARLQKTVGASKNKTAILYVHGYHNDFRDATFRAAQIAYDVAMPDFEVVPMVFSWPSDPGVIGLDYNKAQTRSERAAKDLVGFLKEIAATTDIDTVHIVAHSMGSQVLVRAMQDLSAQEHTSVAAVLPSPKFQRIIFAAADVTPSLFRDVIAPVVRSQQSVTSYVTSVDKALFASQIEHRKVTQAAPRVGNNFKPEWLVRCVDTVDVGDFVTGGLAHSTWAESPRVIDDLRLLLWYGAAPKSRGLSPRAPAAWRVAGRAPPFDRLRKADAAECSGI